MKKLAYIDALRGIAIIGVLFTHFNPGCIENYSSAVQNVYSHGARGVQLFYMVSAFTLFLTATHRHSIEQNPQSNFFIRRFFRIAPMYYIAIIFFILERYYIINNTTERVPPLTDWTLLSNIFLMHGFGPYWINGLVPVGWSVGVEVQFYCLVPLLTKYIKNLNQAFMFLLFAVLLNCFIKFFLWKMGLLQGGRLWAYQFFWFPNQLPAFACGIIAFFLITKRNSELSVDIRLLGIASVIILLDIVTGKNLLFYDIIIVSLLFIPLMYVLSKRNYSLIVNPISIFFGKISYSLYLLHIPVFSILSKTSLVKTINNNDVQSSLSSYVTELLLLLSVTILVSVIFYHFVEVPCQRLGKRIISKFENKETLAVLTA